MVYPPNGAPWRGKSHMKDVMNCFPFVSLLLLLQSERSCGIFTQGAAPTSLCPGLVAGWPYRPPWLKCVQRLAKLGEAVNNRNNPTCWYQPKVTQVIPISLPNLCATLRLCVRTQRPFKASPIQSTYPGRCPGLIAYRPFRPTSPQKLYRTPIFDVSNN